MKEFIFLFRNNPEIMQHKSPEEMQALTKKWMDWIGSIAAQQKLADRGNRLVRTGKTLKPGNVITDGPYAEIKEIISGYSIIKVASYDDALEIAKGCPIFEVGGNVEIREVDIL